MKYIFLILLLVACTKARDNAPTPQLDYQLTIEGNQLQIDATSTVFSAEYPTGYLVVDINKPDTNIVTDGLTFTYDFEPGEHRVEFLVREYDRGWATQIVKHKFAVK